MHCYIGTLRGGGLPVSWLSSPLFLNTLSSREYRQASFGDISTWFPKFMFGKAFIIGYLCRLFWRQQKSCYVLSFWWQEGLQIGLLCLCVTKAVWKNWGLRVSIWQKGTTSSGVPLGPLYIQGICWASQYIWGSTKCHTTGMIQKTLNFGGGWHLPWHQNHFHKKQSRNTDSKLGGTYRSLCEMTSWKSLAQTLSL